MHPQIKRNDPNEVCPICNMALVELEGGEVEAPEHLTLTSQQIQQAGVVTGPVLRRKLYREIDTAGRIDYDERRLAKITNGVSGKSRIEKLHVSFMGQEVTKGEPLAELYSPELITAQHEYLSAMNAASRRSGDNFGIQLLKSARQKLKYQGLTDSQIDRLQNTREPSDRIVIHSPISGTVIQRAVQEGQYVSEGDVLFEVADLSHLWVLADIYEDELPLVAVGAPVQLSVRALPAHTFDGTVAFIDPRVEQQTRTVPVRIDVPNPDGELIPGMFARALVRHELGPVLAVPENAVLSSGQRSVVLLKLGEGRFQPREVKLGNKWLYSLVKDNGTSRDLEFGNSRLRYHEVLAGLSAGDEVVTSGAFLLNAESQFQSVLTKMLPPASEQTTLEQLVGEPLAKRVRETLDAYFKLSATLGEDRLDQVAVRAESLAKISTALSEEANANVPNLADSARRVADLSSALTGQTPKDLHEARTGFGRITRELVKLLADNGGKTLLGKELFIFECGMSKVGYEKWLSPIPEVHNPYMGQKMFQCGTKLNTLEP